VRPVWRWTRPPIQAALAHRTVPSRLGLDETSFRRTQRLATGHRSRSGDPLRGARRDLLRGGEQLAQHQAERIHDRAEETGRFDRSFGSYDIMNVIHG